MLLDLRWCRDLRDIKPLNSLPKLRSLRLQGCLNLNVSSLSSTLNKLRLTELELSRLSLSNADLSIWASSLTDLDLGHCKNFCPATSGVDRLSLTRLCVQGAQGSDWLNVLSGSTDTMQVLCAAGTQVTASTAVAGVPNLRLLDLSHCFFVKEVDALSSMHALQQVLT